MTETKNILKFDPRLGLEKHLTGESSCVNCNCKMYWLHDKWIHDCNQGMHYYNLAHNKCKCFMPEPKKSQTIRNKPAAKIKDKYEIWSMWNEMKKGFYCPNCFTESCLTCKKDLQVYPKKLFDVEITECIDMKIHFTNKIEETYEIVNSLFIIFPSNAKFSERTQIRIPYNTASHPFVKADMPNATNAQFIDFILRYNPKIKEEWAAMYLWKFRRIE